MTVHCLVIQSLPFTATEVELRTYELTTVGSRSGEYLGAVPNTPLVSLRHYTTPVKLLLQCNMQSLQIVLGLCACVWVVCVCVLCVCACVLCVWVVCVCVCCVCGLCVCVGCVWVVCVCVCVHNACMNVYPNSTQHSTLHIHHTP